MSIFKITGSALLCAAAALLPAASPASATQPPVQRAATRSPVLLDCLGKPQTRPGTYVLACADGNNYLTTLHWTRWGAGSATATGTDVANDCLPYCAAGHFHRYPATVVLGRPRPWLGHPGTSRFTRLTVHYTGARPAGISRDITFPLPGSAAD